MQNSSLIIANFTLQVAGKEQFCVSEFSCYNITNNTLWNFLKELTAYSQQVISLETLQNLCTKFDLDIKNLLVALRDELNIIKIRQDKALHTLALDIKDKRLHDALYNDFSQFCTVIPYSQCDSAYGHDDQVIVCYREAYDDPYFEEALPRLSNKQFIISSGIVQRIFHIDNLYSHSSGLPSHTSNLQRMQFSATGNIGLTHNNWLSYYRHLCLHESPRLPIIKPSQCEQGYIGYALMSFVSGLFNPFSSFTRTYDDFNLFWAVNLADHTIAKEVAVHSPFDTTKEKSQRHYKANSKKRVSL